MASTGCASRHRLWRGPGGTNPTGSSEAFTLTFAIGPFAQWQSTHFSAVELDQLAFCGPEADPDQDGMKNSVEFAFGFDPRSGVAVPEFPGLGLPQLSFAEDGGTFYHVLEYPARRAGAQAVPLQYLPQFSSDLDWQTEEITTTTGDFPPELDDLNAVWERVITRRPVGLAASGRGSEGWGCLHKIDCRSSDVRATFLSLDGLIQPC